MPWPQVQRRVAHLVEVGQFRAADEQEQPTAPTLDFDAAAKTILERVMQDVDYMGDLAGAASRAAMRNPCAWALEQSIRNHEKDEPAVFHSYFFDPSFKQRLFDFVLKESYANRPLPEAPAAESASDYVLAYRYVNDRLIVSNHVNYDPDEIPPTVARVEPDGSIVIIDDSARIVYANKAYCDFVGKAPEEIIGLPLRNVRPGTVLPNVLKTKKPILQMPRQETEDTYFVNMYPIFRNGNVVGGISIVTFIQHAKGFQKLLEQVIKRNKQIISRLSKSGNARYFFDDIVAVAPASLQVKELAKRAALTDVTVFLQSESGTGKELYAQAIHNAGIRNESAFISVNCATFNASLLESELFGYAGGAFTGAKSGGNIGLFEAASGGTIFLDEISEMDLALQAKLLRVLQEQRVRPVGSVEERKVDVRVIAASNADLKRYTAEGRFRIDLYYRLNVFPIQIPPLRERREDIELLVYAFLEAMARKFRRNIAIEDVAMAKLTAYHWPGNVRELRNVIEFVSCLTDDGLILADMLPEHIKGSDDKHVLTLQQRVKNYEKMEIMRLLSVNGSDMNGKKKTAAQLGISLAGLYSKISK